MTVFNHTPVCPGGSPVMVISCLCAVCRMGFEQCVEQTHGLFFGVGCYLLSVGRIYMNGIYVWSLGVRAQIGE